MDNKAGINSEVGTAAEVLFCFEAYNRGLCPCVPWGNPACFDLVIMHKKNGKPIVVQVKTGSTKPHGRSFRYQVKGTCLNDSTHLRDTNVQYLIIHTVEYPAWYIVPVKKITGTQVHVYPHKIHSKGSYEMFRERWDYFGFSLGDRVLLN